MNCAFPVLNSLTFSWFCLELPLTALVVLSAEDPVNSFSCFKLCNWILSGWVHPIIFLRKINCTSREFTMWLSQIRLQTHQNTSPGWYQLFIGIYYPMKYFGSRVWLAQLLLLPQLFAIQFQGEKHKLVCWEWVITFLLLLTHLGIWGKSFYLMFWSVCPRDSKEGTMESYAMFA